MQYRIKTGPTGKTTTSQTGKTELRNQLHNHDITQILSKDKSYIHNNYDRYTTCVFHDRGVCESIVGH